MVDSRLHGNQPSAAIADTRRYQRIYLYLDVRRSRNNPYVIADDEDEEEARRPSFWWETEQERLIAENLRPPLDPR